MLNELDDEALGIVAFEPFVDFVDLVPDLDAFELSFLEPFGPNPGYVEMVFFCDDPDVLLFRFLLDLGSFFFDFSFFFDSLLSLDDFSFFFFFDDFSFFFLFDAVDGATESVVAFNRECGNL